MMEQTKEELLQENQLLKIELILANDMYPEQMRMVRNASATIKEIVKHEAKVLARFQRQLLNCTSIFIPRTA